MRAAPALAVLAVVAVLLAGATLALLTLDLGGLSQPLTRWASARAGRALVIDGPVSIRAGRTLRISARDIRIANTSWGSRSDMLLLDGITVEIDALSLVRRPVIVTRVEVSGLDLLLERRADGASNWDFAGDSPDEEPAWPESLPVVVDRVSLPGARIRFAGPRVERPLDLRFDRLEQRRVAGGMLALEAQGFANDEPVTLEGTAGPFAQLVAGRDFTVALDGKLGELLLGMQLRVDDIARPVDTHLEVKLRGPDANYLAAQFAVRNLGPGPLVLDASIRPAASGEGIEGELAGELGQFTIQARGELADPTAMRRLRAQLDLAGPDLGFAGGLAGVDQLPAESFRLTADLERTGDAVRISDATLTMAESRAAIQGTIGRFADLAGNDLHFTFSGNELSRFRQLLGLPAGLDGPFDIKGALTQKGAAETLDVEAQTTLGTLTASGALGPRPDYVGTRLALGASGTNLARLGALAGIERLPAVDFAGSAEFEWTGKGAGIRNGQLRAGSDRLGIDGVIARDPLGPGTDITWSASGPDLRRLAAPLGIDGLPGGAVDLRGRLRREPGSSRLDDVAGTLAGADVRLSGRIADQPRLDTRLDLSVEGPRLEAFAGLVPGYPLPAGPFRVNGALAMTPQRLQLSGMRIAAAGAHGTVDADIELPLSAVRGKFLVVARGKDIARFLPRLGSARTAVAPFELRVRGQARGGAWRLEEAELNTPAASITGSGQLDWAPDFSATALKLTASAPDLAAAGRLFALDLPAQPFALTAEFTGSPAAFEAQHATGRFGGTDFAGRLQVGLGERTTLDMDLRADLLDLTPFIGPPERAAVGATASSGGPRRRRSAPRLIPATPIPFGWLNRVDGSLGVRAGRTLVSNVALEDLRLAARLKNGNLTLDSLELAATANGRVTMSGAIESRPRGAAVRLAGSGTRVRLARLDDTPAVRDARPIADIELELAGEGATWQEMAASLDGTLRLTTGAGVVPVSSMNLLFGEMWLQLAASVAPGVASHDVTTVRCLAAFLVATEGVIQTSPALVMQTDKVNVIAHGSANLATEQIGFYLSTAPRRGRVDVTVGEIVNPYMKVTGTLADPGLGVDPKGVLFSGGAAVATAGLSILAKGVWDRMFKAEDPCAEASAEAARLAAGKPAPARRLIPWQRSRD